MGVSVKIPGADSIQDIAPARDPGVRAEPNDFGANIGESLSHFGDAAVSTASLLDQRRQAAEAAVSLPAAKADFNQRALIATNEATKATPASAEGFAVQHKATLDGAAEEVFNRYAPGLGQMGQAKLRGELITATGHYLTQGITAANNSIVQGLATKHDQTVNTIASNTLATGDVDGGLKQVDESVNALRGAVPESALVTQADKSRRVVIDAAISSALASKDYAKADALTQRFYGSVPNPTKSVYDAIYAQESSSGKNPTTSVTGARGGMQIQPETFALYAKPGEKIDNPADNQAVGKRIIDDLSTKAGGDPARIAVGYFSGPGNIAPPGSPTPWKRDVADPTGKTVSSYVADITKRVGGQSAVVPSSPDATKAINWAQTINTSRMQTVTAASNNAETELSRQLIDAKAGIGGLPQRSAIESNPLLSEDTRNKMLVDYDAAAGDVIQFQHAMKKFTDPNGGSFNPFDKEDKGNVDRIYNALGGDTKALEVVTNRTGIVPEAAVTNLRGAMVSSDPAKVEQSLQVSANLVGGKYPDVFANVKGGEELTKDANTFRHYVYDRGMTAAAATAKIMEERTPEYEQRVKARIKSEDVNDIVKKQLKDSDIRHAFDDSWIPFNDPKLTYSPEMRRRAMGDYEESFRENFAKNGDVSLSKQLALDEMKKTWGTTTVNGAKTVMKYPPERSPVYAGIENPSEQIALQAVSAIKDLNGVDVDRSKLRLDEVKNTAERFMRGQPPTYVLSYTDKNGHVQTIPKQFYADPVAMRSKQIAARAAESAKIQTRVNIDADNADLARANFGVQ